MTTHRTHVESDSNPSNEATITPAYDAHGKLYICSQVLDYKCQGRAFENLNVMNFFVETYDTHIKEDQIISLANTYQYPHSCANQLQQKQQEKGYWTLPNFVGWYFPCSDDSAIHDFYCACMLMSMKPWQSLQNLKMETQTWNKAFYVS